MVERGAHLGPPVEGAKGRKGELGTIERFAFAELLRQQKPAVLATNDMSELCDRREISTNSSCYLSEGPLR